MDSQTIQQRYEAGKITSFERTWLSEPRKGEDALRNFKTTGDATVERLVTLGSAKEGTGEKVDCEESG